MTDYKTIKSNIDKLIEFHSQYVGERSGVENTVLALVGEFGAHGAAVTIANLVNLVGDWDQRIYPKQRIWAESIIDALSRDELNAHGIFLPGDIHPAHIDQIADYARKNLTHENSINLS